MPGKVYTCFQWPFLNIADRVIFDNGFYVSKSEDEEKLIESNGSFGAQILLRDTPEEIEAAKRVAEVIAEETAPSIVVGARNSVNTAKRAVEKKEAVL